MGSELESIDVYFITMTVAQKIAINDEVCIITPTIIDIIPFVYVNGWVSGQVAVH